MENPAQILNLSNACDVCGKVFKTPKGAKAHKARSKKCTLARELQPCKLSDTAVQQSDIPLHQSDSTIVSNKNRNTNKSKDRTIKDDPNLSAKKTVKLQQDKSLIEPIKTLKVTSSSTEHNDHLTKTLHDSCHTVVAAYFDVYVNSGELDNAYGHFKQVRAEKRSKYSVDSVLIYNILLRGFARRFEFARIQELWRDMLTRGIKPDLDSYISSMIALSNADASKNVYRAVYSQVYREFTENGYTVESALKQGSFQFQDRALFIRGLNYFTDTPPTGVYKDAPYENPLLSDLPVTADQLESQLRDVLTRSDLDPLIHRQLRDEYKRLVKVPSIVKDRFHVTPTAQQFMADLEAEWRTHLTTLFTDKIRRKSKLARESRGQNLNMYLFLSAVPVGTLVDIVLNSAKYLAKNSDTYSLSSKQLVFQLGTDLMNAYFQHTQVNTNSYFASEFEDAYGRYLDWFVNPTKQRNHRAALHHACRDFSLQHSQIQWPTEVITMVGRELKDMLLKELSITRDKSREIVVNNKVLCNDSLVDPTTPLSSNPAFFKIFRDRKNDNQIEETKPHPVLSRLYAASKMFELEFSPTELPMVCPPVPWISSDTGSFLHRSQRLVRVS